MPYDPLLRWETEGGALNVTNGRLPRAAEEATSWDQVEPRHIDPEDWLRFQQSIAEIFTAFGMNLETPGTQRTPERFLEALYDATAGYEGDHKLLTAFPTECRWDADCLVSQIVEGPISFYSLCEHHSLPFHGVAHVGYVAHERIIGISKLTRLVRVITLLIPRLSAPPCRASARRRRVSGAGFPFPAGAVASPHRAVGHRYAPPSSGPLIIGLRGD